MMSRSMAFVFPSAIRDLERDTGDDDSRLCVRSPIDVAAATPSDLEELVKDVVFDLSDKELFCVEEQDVFDRVYSLVRDFSALPPNYKSSIFESLRSNLSVLLPNVDSLSRSSSSSADHGAPSFTDHVVSHRNAFKIYTFCLLTIAVSEESNSGAGSTTIKAAASSRKKNFVSSWSWESQRGRLFSLIASSLEIDLSLLFGSSDLDENYLSFVSKCAFSMFESPQVLRDQYTKDALSRIVGTCSTKYHYNTQSCASILHLLHKYDFVPTHIADVIAAAVKKYSDGSLAVSLIREIGRANPKDYARDTAGADNIGRFLVELADRIPKLISMNIGILIPHFGGESYKIRNALLGLLGKLVAKAFKDVEGDASSKSVRLRSKQAMLEILLERCKDVSAYTRSRVLQVWSDLCEQYAVPIGFWNEVASVTAGRLEDKSAIVRKSALNLLITMLQHNPFGPQLRVVSFEATLEKYREKLRGLEPDEKSSESLADELADKNETSRAESDIDQAELDGAEKQESVSDSAPSVAVSSATTSDVAECGNLEETRTLVASLEAGLRFSKCLSSTMPTLVQLLASSSATDVESTIHLLMRCRQFQIDGSEDCLKKMLPLVFSPDKSIYEAVETAFMTIYVKNIPPETAKSLLSLAVEANMGDLAALEFLVGVLASKGDISNSAISALWDFFCFNIRGVTAEQSRGALSVLCMAAKTTPDILSTHLQDIIDIGFGRLAKVEPLLARTACIALERLSEADKTKLLSNYGRKIFGMLERVVLGFGLHGNVWYPAAENAINAIYALHPTPEIIAADLVKKSVSSLFNEGDELEIPINFDYLSSVKVAKLSKFLFVVSHVAMNQLVYIDLCLRKIQKQKNSNKLSSAMNDIGEEAEVVDQEAGINAELGLHASEDSILDNLSERAGQEIVSSSFEEKYLIGYCAPFVSKLCRNFGLTQKFPELQASGVLALCRLMIIDADFCEQNLQLLFTIVENSPSETVRSNCIIAIGDLAVRFPNFLEPWTENVYGRLRDSSTSVRKNAVLVLSHLILNDMMKVKGYIFEMAMRLEDDDDRISGLAKLFFHELSKKGNNPIYNLLPDILGRLSNQNLQEEIFCNIMQFLIGSIKKDKQMEALVEKLCNRFSTATDSQQWQHIAYCLSQLTFTEKGIKKLMESFKAYQDALFENPVMEHFENIIQKAKKFAKPDTKTCIEEFEEKLKKFRLDKMAQEETAKNAKVHQENSINIMSFGVETRKDENLDNDFESESGVRDGGEVIDPPLEELQSENSPTESRESQIRSRTSGMKERPKANVQLEETVQKGASKSIIKKNATVSEETERGSTNRSRNRRRARSKR